MAMLENIRRGEARIPMLNLGPSDIDEHDLPKPHVLSIIGMLTPRMGDQSKPGFVVLPNVAELFSSKYGAREVVRRVENFQHVLMDELFRHLSKTKKTALAPQAYLDLPEREAMRLYRKAKPGVGLFVVQGTTGSYKFPHMDSLQHLIISLCYHPRHNVRGGTPLLFDLTKSTCGLAGGEVTRFPEKPLYRREERVVLLRKEHRKAVLSTQITLEGLDYGKMPILIASNRVEDGIMHGATPVRKIEPSKRWSRPISYVAITCH